jgi:SNF2 family DNA or RNA helicase
MSFTIDQYTWPAFQGRKPFMHQIPTVKFMLDNKRGFILNEMGTGKTLSAIWACDILLTANKIKRVLIVGPLSTMRSVWFNEFAYNLPHRKVGIAHGAKPLRLSIINDKSIEFVIINHDGIKNSEDEIIAQNFDLIIIDELTAFKSHTSERSKCMERISKTVKAVWGMTGEITPNSPLEAYYPCKIVNPFNKWLPKYFGQFRDACMAKVNEMLWIPKPESPQIVAMCVQPAIRFTREQCLDLPDTTYQMIETELSEEQKSYYNLMKSKAIIECDGGTITAQNAAVMLNKLLQISAGAVKTADGSVIEIGCQPRLDQLLQIYDETPQKKLVVFATYRATIEMLVRELSARKIKCAAIHGDVNQNIRAKLIDDFQASDLNILVLQPQSTAHGITLTAASTIVWFSLIPSNELTQQGNARIIRAGQTRKTLIIMFASTKAEKHIAKILQRKGDISRETLQLFVDHDI